MENEKQNEYVEKSDDSTEEYITEEYTEAIAEAALSVILPESIDEKPAIAIVDDSLPPDGGYGWVVVICSCLIAMTTYGITAVRDIILFQNTYRLISNAKFVWGYNIGLWSISVLLYKQ